MNSNTTNTEDNNLVMFPSAKNFLKVDTAHDLVDGLLNEFSHLTDDDIPSYLDDRFDDLEIDIEEQTFESLEAFMNRNKALMAKEDREDHLDAIESTLAEIAETKNRIKFYLDEIEMFLPRRN